MDEWLDYLPALVLIIIVVFFWRNIINRNYFPYQYEADGDYVIVLHGLFRTYKSMNRIARYLHQQGGYHVINVPYDSRNRNIEELAAPYLKGVIEQHCVDEKRTIHFVTFSMGGILARYYIQHCRPEKLGKVVMLAPPNYGSEVADFLRDNRLTRWLYRKIWGKAGQQLGTREQDLPKQLESAHHYELGIISGCMGWISPLCYHYLLDKPNDGTVSEQSTKLEGYNDHLSLLASHSFIMYSPIAAYQTLNFLKQGSFIKDITHDA